MGCATVGVAPETKRMGVSIHFYVPRSLFGEMLLAFHCCYFSPEWFLLWPVWVELNWPLVCVIDTVWLPGVCSSPPRWSNTPKKFTLFSSSSLPGAYVTGQTWETAAGKSTSPRRQHLKRPRGLLSVCQRQRGQCDFRLHANVTQIGKMCEWQTDSLSSIGRIETHPAGLTHT